MNSKMTTNSQLSTTELKNKNKNERKKELIPFATAWMELENIMLSEISHLVKDKYHMISLIRGI